MTVTQSDSHIKLKFTSVKSCVSCCKLLCKWFECHVSKRPATQCDAGLSDSVSRPRFGSAALRSSAWAQAWAVLMHVASFVLQLRKLIWMILNVHLKISSDKSVKSVAVSSVWSSSIWHSLAAWLKGWETCTSCNGGLKRASACASCDPGPPGSIISSRIFLESSRQTYTEYTFVHMVLDRACYHVGSREPVVGFFFTQFVGLWSSSFGPCVPSRTTILWWAMPRNMSLSRSGTCSCQGVLAITH